MPASLTISGAGDYEFDVPVTVTCRVCGEVLEEAALDLGSAWSAAREHEHKTGSRRGLFGSFAGTIDSGRGDLAERHEEVIREGIDRPE